MPKKNTDKNAHMRFVATDNDTNKPVANARNKRAVNAFKKKLNGAKK